MRFGRPKGQHRDFPALFPDKRMSLFGQHIRSHRLTVSDSSFRAACPTTQIVPNAKQYDKIDSHEIPTHQRRRHRRRRPGGFGPGRGDTWRNRHGRAAYPSLRMQPSRHDRSAAARSCSAPGRWAIEGTPADCVRVGLAHLLPDADWILSGINHGGNLGADVHVSGTVAAVREAVLHGKPGHRLIAIQKARTGDRLGPGGPLGHSRARATSFRRPGCPALSGISTCPICGRTNPNRAWFLPVGNRPLPLSFRREADLFHYNGVYHQRRRQPGSDVDVCFGGDIAVTRISPYFNMPPDPVLRHRGEDV